MPSAYYRMDNFLCTGGSHLTLNLVTEGVELTGQNKLALIGFAFTLEVVIIIAVPTSKLLMGGKSTFRHSTSESPGHDTSQALSFDWHKPVHPFQIGCIPRSGLYGHCEYNHQ